MGKIGEWFEQQVQRLDSTEQGSELKEATEENVDNVSRETFVALQSEVESLRQQLEVANSKGAELAKLRSDLAAAQALNVQLAAQSPLNANKKTFSEILRGESYHPLYKGE